MHIHYSYILIIYRAWQRKLHNTVTDNEHRVQIYACLWMLINEQDVNSFIQKQETFLSYWQEKEAQFVNYFKEEYQDRAGNQ